MTLLPGISSRKILSSRIESNILERSSDTDKSFTDDQTVVFVHGNVSSSLFWQEIMLKLPETVRPIAVDLRGFGDSETKAVDATRGVSDWSDDLHTTLQELGIGTAHLVGWSLGGGVVMQYALDYPVLTLTLQAPVSPYGFGGTREDGTLLNPEGSGTGAGGANPDFIARLNSRDTSADEQTSPRSVFRSSYVAPGYSSEHEDIWVESMLSTATGEGNYPGNVSTAENWPGFAPGTTGNLNTLAPTNLNLSALVDLPVKPAILWIRGDSDAIVSDASFFDLNYLGQLGIIPGWPGEEAAPPQAMVTQTRNVLSRYRDNGGSYTEVVFEGKGHSPHLEDPDRFILELLKHLG